MLNDIIDFEWKKPDTVRVDNESIITINSGGLKYHPFDRFYEDREFRLYIEFSKVDTLKDIEGFILSYGMLGLDILNVATRLSLAENAIKETINKLSELSNSADLSNVNNIIENFPRVFKGLSEGYQPLIDHLSVINSNNDSKKRLKSRDESTTDFLVEAKLMKGLLWLNSIDFSKYKDLDTINKTIQELSKLVEPKDQSRELYDRGIEFSSYCSDGRFSDRKVLEWSTKAFITAAVTLQLEAVSPSLSILYNKEKWNYDYAMSYRPKNLLGAMYIMFALDLVGGNRTVLCEVCHQPLLIVDDRNKKCHKKCTSKLNTQLSREREKQANELYKEGKSISKIHEIINQNSQKKDIKVSQIEKWIGLNKKESEYYVDR